MTIVTITVTITITFQSYQPEMKSFILDVVAIVDLVQL